MSKVDYLKVFGKDAIALGDNAWAAWKQDVWQPLGIKDATATKRAGADGKGGTRAAMLAVMHYGTDNLILAAQAADYIRVRYLGNTASARGSGISFGWFATYANMATVASNATWSADSKGVFKLRATTRKPTASKASKPRKVASDSRNGEVKVVRESDKAREAAMADIAATVEAGA